MLIQLHSRCQSGLEFPVYTVMEHISMSSTCQVKSPSVFPSFKVRSPREKIMLGYFWNCKKFNMILYKSNMPLRCHFIVLKFSKLCFFKAKFSSQSYGFFSSHVWMWELDYEEGQVPKNWCFWTVVLEKTLESPLDCKEIQPVHSEGDQPWDFFGRNEAKAETPVLWPPHAKSWLIGKDSDDGRDWGQEEKGTTEDEMVGWHHWLDGCESEWTPGVGDEQGGLACCDSWGCKELDTTEWLNWIELLENVKYDNLYTIYLWYWYFITSWKPFILRRGQHGFVG